MGFDALLVVDITHTHVLNNNSGGVVGQEEHIGAECISPNAL